MLASARLAVGLAVLLVAAFGVLDVLVQPEITGRLWLIRYGIMTPGLVLLFGATYLRSLDRYIEWTLLGVVVVAASGILGMILISPAPGRYYYYAGLILVIMADYTFLRLRFAVANAAGWVVVLAYFGAEVTLSRTPWNILVNNMFFFVAANIIGMFAAYLLESLSRRNFLQEMLVRRAREFGRYRLTARLGQGGMGEVWRAEHRMLARPAAIKLIRAEMMGASAEGDGDRAALRRFSREARATALLRSPHTVEVYDFGVTEEGTFYYVMELLDGYDLQRMVSEFGPVTPGRAVHLLRQACHSLAEAHEQGLIHRDVKPANIYVCEHGRDADFVKVLDFGIVKWNHDSGRELDLTQEAPTGTPACMAPEQILGGAPVDGRADLYGLGCVAYWLLTGRRLFHSRTAVQMFAGHLNVPAPPPSRDAPQEIPPELDRIVLECLEKEPAKRPESAEALDARLARCGGLDPWTTTQARRWWREHPNRRPERAPDGDRTVIPAMIRRP